MNTNGNARTLCSTLPASAGAAAGAGAVEGIASGASLAPALAGALDTLMRAYMPCAGAVQPPTYADWIPAGRDWPADLRLLHSACIDARRAWAQATDAYTAGERAGVEDRGLGSAATLAGVAYYAVERATREAIAAWERGQDRQDVPAPVAGVEGVEGVEREGGAAW